MQNITELRQSLADNYEDLKNNKIELKLAKELANTAGKIINSLKVELEYNTYLGVKNEIKFLNVD